MEPAALLYDLFGRIPPLIEAAVEHLDADSLARRPKPAANTIGWLGWHVGRVIDAQISPLAGTEQVWVHGDWARRMGLEPDPSNTGYGHTPEQVEAVRPEGPEVIVAYLRAVHAASAAYLTRLTAFDLDQVIDQHWEPPVTLGVRLLSIAEDCFQHAGQAAYIRGLLKT